MSRLPSIVVEQPAPPFQDLLEVDESIAQLSKKISENSNLLDEYIELGKLLRKKGDYQKSYLLLRNLLARDELRREQLARVNAELGYDYLLSRTKDQGEKYFLESLKLNQNSAYALEGLYQCYRRQNELEKAADVLRLVCKTYPNRKKDLANLLTEVALHKAEHRHMSSAKKCIDQALEFDSNSSLAYLTKAHLESLEGRKKEAIETLEAFIEKWPHDTLFALKKIEGLHYEMNQYSRYAYTLTKCIQKNPQNFYAHHAYGIYLIKIRKADEAMIEFNKALEICPYAIQSLKELIKLYSINQNIPESLEVIEKFISSLPGEQVNGCPRCRENHNHFSKNCAICNPVV